jgi:hypothetical protein
MLNDFAFFILFIRYVLWLEGGLSRDDEVSEATTAAGGNELVTITDGIATVVVAQAIGGAIASFRRQGADGAIDRFRPAAALAGREAGELGRSPLAPYSNASATAVSASRAARSVATGTG